MPVLMLTARTEDIDKVAGWRWALMTTHQALQPARRSSARVKRRCAGVTGTAQTRPSSRSPVVTVGNVELDPASREVRVAGELVRLRHREFDLLHAFLKHPNVVLDRERLLSMVWGQDYYGDARTINVHVASLREKLHGANAEIETVWGVGYKLTSTGAP